MEKYKSKYLKGYLMLIIFMVVYSVSSEFLEKYIDGFNSISTYYKSMGMTEKSKYYNYIYYTFKHYWAIIPIYILLSLAYITEVFKYKKQFKDYPYIIHDYRAYYYFCNTTILLLLSIFILLEPLLFREFWTAIVLLISLPLIIVFLILGNKIYNNVIKRINLIMKHNFEVSDGENMIYKKYKIVPIFYVVLVIFIFIFVYKVYEFTPYIEYSSYPNELVINEDSYFSDETRLLREEDTLVSFTSFDDLFDHYKVNKIELKIDSENSIEMLENSDYQILIQYNLKKYYLTSDDFTLDKSNNEYKYIINLGEYLKEYDLKNEDLWRLDISFVNDSEEPFEKQPTAEYSITIVKIKKIFNI